MLTFICCDCSQEKPMQDSGGPGYAVLDDGRKVCYACCAERDKAYMVEHGRITLYFDNKARLVTNWPGTLWFDCAVRTGNHNIAGIRYDVWFTDHLGKKWHGVRYGHHTQLCHCKRLK